MQAEKRRPHQLKQHQKQLNIARLDFQIMKKDKTLPQKMQLKLQYLQNKILGKSFNANQYQELPSYQISSLQQCSHEDQVKLFISIIKCLSGKETIIYIKDEKAYIRKQETFSMWTKCYLTVDTLNLIAKKKAQKKNWLQFNLNEIRPSKKYVQYKRKTAFGMIYKNERYMIGFDLESACQRILSLIRQLVKQNTQKKQKIQSNIKFEGTLQKSMNPHFSFGRTDSSPHSEVSYSPRKVLQFQMIGEYEEHQIKIVKNQQQNLIEQQINKLNFSSDKDYKLYNNFEFGRILIGKEDYKVKMTHLFQNNYKFENILQLFLDMKNWNLQIQQCTIVNKINQNSYNLYFRLKKYSFMSLPRDAYAIATCILIGQKMYLLIRNVENQDDLPSYGVVRAKFNQSIEILRNKEQNDLILMTIINQINFCGYSSATDNINMTIHLMQDFQTFHTFLLSQSIAQNSSKLFSFDTKVKEFQNGTYSVKKRKQSVAFSEISQKSMSQSMAENSQQGQSQILEKQGFNFEIKSTKEKQQQQFSINKYKQTQNQIIKEFQSFQKQFKASQKLLAFIRDKIYQRHYLKHNFAVNEIKQIKKYPKQFNFLLQNGKWKMSQSELIFIDQQILNSQKNVIKFILKQISSNILAGKNIMNMSLPVQIFQAKSFLQKLAQGLGFLPLFLDQASYEVNIIKQIMLVNHAFSFIGAILPNIQKPFNPILGQTLQCSIGGVCVYFQQISHHPPISAFYLKTQRYCVYGAYHPQVQMGLNTALAKNLHSSYVEFYQTNTKYQIRMPDYQISGLMFGDRKLKMSGKAFVFQQINGILCELSFGKDKKKVYQNSTKKVKPGQIIGGVYKVTNAFNERFKTSKNSSKGFEGVKYDQVIQKFHQIKGNWYGQIFVDNVLVKNIYQPAPFCYVKDVYILPSDCSYRLDVYFKKSGDLKKSQQQKQILQNSQRKDRKLREEFGPKIKHK